MLAATLIDLEEQSREVQNLETLGMNITFEMTDPFDNVKALMPE